jgi:hypothetical protein
VANFDGRMIFLAKETTMNAIDTNGLPLQTALEFNSVRLENLAKQVNEERAEYRDVKTDAPGSRAQYIAFGELADAKRDLSEAWVDRRQIQARLQSLNGAGASSDPPTVLDDPKKLQDFLQEKPTYVKTGESTTNVTNGSSIINLAEKVREEREAYREVKADTSPNTGSSYLAYQQLMAAKETLNEKWSQRRI